jgi:hypothetical protein
MGHFAEFIVFNGFNPISFGAGAKAAVAGADDKPGPRRRRFLKNNTARQRLWQEIVGFLSPAPARLASRFGRIADLAKSSAPTSERLKPRMGLTSGVARAFKSRRKLENAALATARLDAISALRLSHRRCRARPLRIFVRLPNGNLGTNRPAREHHFAHKCGYRADRHDERQAESCKKNVGGSDRSSEASDEQKQRRHAAQSSTDCAEHQCCVEKFRSVVQPRKLPCAVGMRPFVSLHLTGQLLDPVGDTVEPACEDAKQTGQGCEEKGGCQGGLNDMCDVVERSEQSWLLEPGRSSNQLPRNHHRGQSD